jgi:hypothetical protein
MPKLDSLENAKNKVKKLQKENDVLMNAIAIVERGKE